MWVALWTLAGLAAEMGEETPVEGLGEPVAAAAPSGIEKPVVAVVVPRRNQCGPWNSVGKRVPWPDCSGSAKEWICHRPEVPSDLAALAQGCLEAPLLHDEPRLVLRLPEGTLTLTAEGDGTLVSLR